LKGGNVITVSESYLKSRELLHSPITIATPLWALIAKTHNLTQLGAIKYVISRINLQDDYNLNDTSISLIQGPPGTGKTRTIIALVSALMHLELPKSNSEDHDIDRTISSKTSTNRLLICAPSNAAIDEVLLRLLKNGGVNRAGKSIKLNLIRLGKPTENCPEEILNLTLENRVEKLLQNDSVWKKLQKASEEVSSLKSKLMNLNQDNKNKKPDSTAFLTESVGSGFHTSDEQRRKLRSELRIAQSFKISAEVQVSLKRTEIRKRLLETCDVLAGM
jgi:senataxin